MSFWKHLKSIFAKQPDSTQTTQEAAEQLLLHELISRSEQEKQQYAEWEGSDSKKEMLEWIAQEHAQFKRSKKQPDAPINFLMIPSVNGFVIHYEPARWDSDDMQHLFDYFKNKAKELGYWSHVSDIRAVRKGKLVETSQRHYLKPARNFAHPAGEPLPQQYGNLMITLNFTNEKLCNLKLCATSYNDRMYAPALDFGELMQHFLGL